MGRNIENEAYAQIRSGLLALMTTTGAEHVGAGLRCDGSILFVYLTGVADPNAAPCWVPGPDGETCVMIHKELH